MIGLLILMAFAALCEFNPPWVSPSMRANRYR